MPEIVFVTIPQETVNDESVRILSWKVASGSKVEKDQPLCEVETSKAVMDIEAPAAGVVVYSTKAGEEVPVGSTICEIVPEGMMVTAQSVPAVVQSAADVVQSAAAIVQSKSDIVQSAAARLEIPSDAAIEPVIDAAD